jgi:hypothetical protein
MTSIADAVVALAANQRPVLALDTCVPLDIIRAGMRSQTDLIEGCRRLSEIVVTDPDRVQLVVTSLVVIEWGQNKDQVRQEMTDWIIESDRRVLEIHRTWDRVGSPVMTQAPTYMDPRWIDLLTSLGESLIQGAVVLDDDNGCVMRAIDRLKQKRRPSHRKEIKDSIHLEHYLEISRQLHAAGYTQPAVFVSTNSSDFWADKNTPSAPHTDLEAELAAAHLTFYGKIEFALRHLAIIPGAPPAAGGP